MMQLRIIFFCGLLFPILANAEIYKWKDADNRIHYSDTPQPNSAKQLPFSKEQSKPKIVAPVSVKEILVKDDKRTVVDKMPLNKEAIYSQQPRLISNNLSSLKVERKGIVDLYFVGFAGSAQENVFLNEVRFSQQLFNKKFDTTDRSVLLVNHKETVDQIPLANTENLASTLNGVANLMNKNEDILFLFLSSHGSKQFELSTSFFQFETNTLPAKKVKQLLDSVGIKNRIIVVSACYSGGFIEILRDENTVIITAARNDRTSFGCSNELEYTYFGDAYFVQALSKERSFIKAFTQAEKIIAAREKKGNPGSLPSLPQIFVGKAIESKLNTSLAKPSNL